VSLPHAYTMGRATPSTRSSTPARTRHRGSSMRSARPSRPKAAKVSRPGTVRPSPARALGSEELVPVSLDVGAPRARASRAPRRRLGVPARSSRVPVPNFLLCHRRPAPRTTPRRGERVSSSHSRSNAQSRARTPRGLPYPSGVAVCPNCREKNPALCPPLAAASAEGGAEEAALRGQHLGVALAQGLEELGRALDIGENEGDRAAWEVRQRESPLRARRRLPAPGRSRARETRRP
jgi:hypothetical protein